MIGLAISTHNRNEIAQKCLDEWRKLSPGIKIVVVDDASKIPFKGADYRFEENAGIARVKNKCLELLEDCEHIFLADDDIHATVHGWHLPYVNSEMNHLCFTFNREVVFDFYSRNGHTYKAYSLPCGLMLYYSKKCLETVGGFDEEYEGYSYEHVDLSKRIFNAGLTIAPFIDYSDSLSLFYSYDYHRAIMPSSNGRAVNIPINKARYEALGDSKEFKPYK